MPGLTSKELTAVEDQLSIEQNLVQKFTMYARTSTDPQIKEKCEQIAGRHQNHYNCLLNQLMQ